MANTLRIEVLLAAIDKATTPFRNITKGAAGAAEAVRKSKEALAALDNQKVDISAYARLRAQLRGNAAELAEFTEKSRAAKTVLNAQRSAHHELGGEVKAARATIKQYAAAMAEQKAPSAAAIASYQAQQQALAKLETRYSLSTAALRKQKDAVRGADGQLKRLSAANVELTGKVEANRQKLEAAGLSTNKLASRQRELRSEVKRATDAIAQQTQRAEAMARTQERMAKVSSKLTRGGMMAAAHGAGAWALKDQFAAPGKTMLAAFAEQETAATQLRGSMMGANNQVSAGYQKISALAQELGNQLPGTTAELLEMMTMLKRQGMSDTVILGGLGKTAAYLGTQLQMPYIEAAEFAAKLQDATRTTEGDMLKLGDTIQRAFYLGVDHNNMLQGFVKLSPAMDILRVRGLEATKTFAPLLVMLDQMGMKGEQSGNALRKVFQATMDTGNMKDINTVMRERGSAIRFDFTDGKGEFGGLDKFFAQISQLKKLTTEDRLSVMGMMFGDDSETLTSVNAMIDKGKAGYDEVQRKMAAQASLQARVNASLGTLGNLWEAATGTFRNALAAFGEAAAPQIADLTKWLGVMSEKIMGWAKANPRAAATIVKLSLGAGLLLGVLGAILVPLGLLAGAVGHLVTAWTAISGAFAASGIALGGLVTPLLIVAGAGLLIWKYWEPIKAFLGGVWDGLLQGLQPVMPVLGMLGETLASLFSPAKASEESLANIANIGQFVGEVLGGLMTLVIVPLGLALQGLATIFKFVGERIGAIIGFVVTGAAAFGTLLKGIFTLDGPTILAGFQAIWQNLNQFFGGLPSKLAQVGINMVQGLVNGILSMLGAPGKALAKVADSAIGKLRGLLGIKSPSRVFAELGSFTMQGFTQGLQGGERGAQGALQRIAAGLRATGAGITLGALAAPAVASPVPPQMPAMEELRPQTLRILPHLEALNVLPRMQAMEELQPQALRILPQLQALNALPALQVDVLPRMQALRAGLQDADHGDGASGADAQAGPRFDTRPPLLASGAPGAASRAGGNSYSITIHAGAAKAEDIARLVREEIDKLEHQRGVRGRSSMSDYDE